MRRRISIRGRVRPSFRPSVLPVLFSNDEKRHFLYSDDYEIFMDQEKAKEIKEIKSKCKKDMIKMLIWPILQNYYELSLFIKLWSFSESSSLKKWSIHSYNYTVDLIEVVVAI